MSKTGRVPETPTFAEQARADLRERLREQVMDVMYDAITQGRYPTTSMATIARAVGVSRQTLYNEFGSREGLVGALAARENQVLLGLVAQTLDEHPGDLPAGAAAAVELVLARAADDPLHKALFGGEPELMPVLPTLDRPVLEHSKQVLAAYVRQHYPQIDPEDVAALTDAVVRLAHSHVVLPHDPAEMVAARISRLVDRFIQGGQR